MKIVDHGHKYVVDSLDGDFPQLITFVKRFRGEANHPGTTNQELLRVMIHRVIALDGEKPWPLNDRILHHLRMALVLHEARALERKVEKTELAPERVYVDPRDGHFALEGYLHKLTQQEEKKNG